MWNDIRIPSPRRQKARMTNNAKLRITNGENERLNIKTINTAILPPFYLLILINWCAVMLIFVETGLVHALFLIFLQKLKLLYYRLVIF